MKPLPPQCQICGSYVRAPLIMLEEPSETCCGGVDCFPRPFESFAEIYTKFHEISTENECSGHWDSGNRVRTSSEGLRRQNSVFLSSDFCFSPKSKFLNDFENGKSIETRKYFLEWRKTQNKKLVSAFLIIRANFFFRSRITRKLEEIERI